MESKLRIMNPLRGLTSVLLWMAAAIAIASQTAQAHTVSIGYENAGPGALRFWYGTYHGNDGINFEGSFTLVGINGNTFPSTTVPFSLSTLTKPAGLIDGTTNFYPSGTSLSGTPYPLAVRKWQGVTFTGLAAGDYRFTYNPKVNPTLTWAPISSAVNSSTVTVTIAQLIAAPNAVAGSDLTVNQGAAVSLNGNASTDGNTPALSLSFAWAQISGPAAVALSGANTATPSFTAPSAPAVPSTGAAMVFRLTVSNGASSSPGTDTVTVNVRGNSSPIANAGSNQTVAAGANCTALVALSGSGSSDSDGTVVSYSWSGAFGTASGASPTVTLAKGSNTIVLTVTDNLGATGTSQVVVNVVDLTPPTLLTPAVSTVVESDGAGNVAALNAWLATRGGANATDNCGSVTWSNNYTGLTAACGATGSATVVFTATDTSGLASTTTATFTIADTTAPAIVAAAAGQSLESDGAGNTAALSAWLVSRGGASATDIGSAVTWSNNFAAVAAACGTTGSASVTFTAADACGNKSTTTATFTIVDTIAPTIVTAAASKTVESDGAGNLAALNAWLTSNGGASATDLNGVTWSNNFTAVSDGCGATGTTSVTFTATDACGNASSTVALFTIVDTTKPAIVNAAGSQQVESDGAGNLAALNAWLASNGGASATDVNGVTWSNDFGSVSDGCGATGSVTVTFTAKDACNNISTTTATFKIVDTVNPVIGAPAANQVVESDGAGNVAALSAWLASNAGATASDVGGAVTWSHNYTTTSMSDGCGSTGAVTVTFTATDACGNASSSTATFTIVDTTKPVLSSNVRNISPNEKPITFTVSSTDIGGTSTPTITSVTATRVNGSGKTLDKTGPYKHSVSGNKVTIEISGGVDTVWTISTSAVDECGNTATATFVVNVVNPTLTK